MIKIAYFGGSFNPVHIGHLKSAKFVLDNLGLDELYFMPNATPPHKESVALSYEQRCHLLECALQDCHQERFKLSYLEKDSLVKHYTYETLERLHELHPDAELFFIIGMDSLINFKTWKNWEHLVDKAHIVVLNRPGYDIKTLDSAIYEHIEATHKKYQAHQCPYDFMILDSPPYDISSTQLREALSNLDSSNCAQQDACELILMRSLSPRTLQEIQKLHLLGA